MLGVYFLIYKQGKSFLKNILITGAARGLGFALASIFYNSGNRLFLVVRRKEDLKNLEQEFKGSGILVCDVTSPDYEEELSKLIGDEKIDVVINNAGSMGKGSTTKETSTDQLLNEFKSHCGGALASVKGCLAGLEKSENPLVLNISSRRGSLSMQAQGKFKGIDCSFSYRMAKAAQNMLTISMAEDFLEKGIRVAAIHPGRLLTRMAPDDASLTPDESAKRIYDLIESGKIKTGEFLCVENGSLSW